MFQGQGPIKPYAVLEPDAPGKTEAILPPESSVCKDQAGSPHGKTFRIWCQSAGRPTRHACAGNNDLSSAAFWLPPQRSCSTGLKTGYTESPE